VRPVHDLGMTDRRWSAGSVGVIEGGQYGGMYVEVEQAKHGFHIWLLTRHPHAGLSEGWDIWADAEDDVDEWFAADLGGVRWLAGLGQSGRQPPAELRRMASACATGDEELAGGGMVSVRGPRGRPPSAHGAT
jgi:hypothetical protein